MNNDPTDLVSMNLQGQEWMQLLEVLGGTGPWRVVNPLIVKLAQQLDRLRAENAQVQGNVAQFGKPSA